MPASYALKGIPLPTVPDPKHPIPVRQDIDAWYSNPDNAVQVSLFIQAMIKFQKTDFNNMLSYYQVSGIHSLPKVEWDNVPGGEYCNHNTATFPTWHRPYLLLFEKILYELMLEIIEKDVPADEKDLWKISASHWRFPYWDWAVKSKLTQNYSVPQLLTKDKVTIRMPHMKTQTVENPLWQFTNPAGIPMGDKRMGKYAIPVTDNDTQTRYWVQCVATSKFGVVEKTPPEKWIHGVQNWQKANDALQHPAWYDLNDTTNTKPPLNLGSIGEAVYRMFTPNYFDSWQAFASTLYNEKHPGGTNFLSLEYIHNNIHGFAGGVDIKTGMGQMGDVPVAAFDPIFWLHHCNVDRQCAIWQTLNPNKWFDSPTPGDNLPTDPLKPFHTDTESHFWTSEMVRDWTKLGYQYDDLEPPKHMYSEHGVVDRNLYIPGIKKILNECYSSRDQLLNAPDVDGCQNDYIVNILYDRYALNGQSYAIYFFIGNVEGEADSYSLHPHQVGSVYTFSSGVDLNQESSCSNCKKQKDSGALSMAQIHISIPLLQHAQDPAKQGFDKLTPDAVSEYLTANLHWKATSAGEPIGMDQLPRTKIFVMKGTAQHTPDVEHLSHYTDYSPMWEACAGKPGAAHPADGLA